MMAAGFGWIGIVRLGLVQAAIGAIVMLATSLINRLMVVEYGLAAAIPAGLVAWHYGVQLSRPLWGHGSDQARRRTPWVLGGIAVLGTGGLTAVAATVLLASNQALAIGLAVVGFTLVGIGVGAGGTSLLALLASGVAPERRAAAAAVTWIMMVMGIVIAAGTTGALLDPYSPARLAVVAACLVVVVLTVATLALWRLEPRNMSQFTLKADDSEPLPSFREALQEILDDREARRLTAFIFVSMLAYSMQDLILEPFAGLVFGMTPGQSTSLAGVQHGGVLAGMIAAGVGGSAFVAGRRSMRGWIIGGCIGSAVALATLAIGAGFAPGWPIAANVFLLGLANGVFAVAAIGSMMALAGAGHRSREGVRMGVWGAAQAIAFGLGGLLGAVGVDLARAAGQDVPAFQLIFTIEAALFLVSAILAVRVPAARPLQQGIMAT